MNQRFAIHLMLPVGILASAFVVLCGTSFAQQSDSSSLPRAEQVSPVRQGAEWRHRSGGAVFQWKRRQFQRQHR